MYVCIPFAFLAEKATDIFGQDNCPPAYPSHFNSQGQLVGGVFRTPVLADSLGVFALSLSTNARVRLKARFLPHSPDNVHLLTNWEGRGKLNREQKHTTEVINDANRAFEHDGNASALEQLRLRMEEMQENLRQLALGPGDANLDDCLLLFSMSDEYVFAARPRRPYHAHTVAGCLPACDTDRPHPSGCIAQRHHQHQRGTSTTAHHESQHRDRRGTGDAGYARTHVSSTDYLWATNRQLTDH